jgi:hypothetical protein
MSSAAAVAAPRSATAGGAPRPASAAASSSRAPVGPLPPGAADAAPAGATGSGISVASLEAAINARFENELAALKLFESDDGNAARAAAVRSLETVLLGAVTHIGVSKGMPEADAARAGARLLPFGSYREGVHGPSGDLDLLALVPGWVERAEFFAVLPALLCGEWCARTRSATMVLGGRSASADPCAHGATRRPRVHSRPTPPSLTPQACPARPRCTR